MGLSMENANKEALEVIFSQKSDSWIFSHLPMKFNNNGIANVLIKNT